jgi:hypothetical protein
VKPDEPVEWPAEDESVSKRRRRRSWIGVPGSLTTIIDLGEDEGPTTKRSMLRAAVPAMIVVVVLVVVGLILAMAGPLPRIFPLVNSN